MIKKAIITLAAMSFLAAAVYVGFTVFFAFSNDSSDSPVDSGVINTNALNVSLSFDDAQLDSLEYNSQFEVVANTGDISQTQRVEFYIDDTLVSVITRAPFVLTIDASDYGAGSYSLKAIAYNQQGQSFRSDEYGFVIKERNKEQTPTIDRVINLDAPVGDQIIFDGTTTEKASSKLQDAESSPDPVQPAGLIVSLTSLSVTEVGAQEKSFSVKLSKQPEATVVLDVLSEDVANATVNPTSLVFTKQSWNSYQSVVVKAVDDQIDDGNVTFAIRVAVNDGSSSQEFRAVTDKTVSVTVIDDDTAGLEISPSGPQSLNEAGAESDMVAVSLTSMPVSDVVVDVVSSDPSNVIVSPSSLLFTNANWDMPQYITLQAVDDALDDDDVVVSVSIVVDDASSSDDYDSVASRTIAVTAVDDEINPDIVLAPNTALTLSETGGASSNVAVTLEAAPVADVVVDVSSSDSGNVTVSPSSLTFTPANWQIQQDVTIQAVNDEYDDGDQAVIVTFAINPAASSDEYDAVADRTIAVTATDDDTAGFSLTPSYALSLDESTSETQLVAVELDARPTSDVVINVTSDDASNVTAHPASLVFTELNWSTPQYVTLQAVDDVIDDGNITAIVTYAVNGGSSATEFGAVVEQTMSVTAVDDEETAPLRAAGGWWSALPTEMQICDANQTWLEGPSTAPVGAVVVPAGDNSGVNFTTPNTTYWFAPGIHTLGSTLYSQILPGNNSRFVGAPGAIIDGQNLNLYAFGGHNTNVTIEHLEIRNFGRGTDNNNEGVINHDAGNDWTVNSIYAHHNDGAAVFMGSNNTLENSCLKENGQYGFSMYRPPIEGDSAVKNVVIHNNEIAANNQDDWETLLPGCGCSGAGKFWDTLGATVTNNYVHGNLSTGLWADTNNIDFLFDSNWIEGNDGEGIWYEVSYNVTISRNVFKNNAWVKGQSNLGSPAPAVYLSESGGDSRLPSTVSGSTDVRVMNNLMEDNFSGVSIYENSNRFCNSNGNTSKGYCTPFISPTLVSGPHDYAYPNPISDTHPCYTDIGSEPYTTDCRWSAQNIKVTDNEFRFDSGNVPCAGSFCGAQALIATGADNIPWAPTEYGITNVQNDVMFNKGNEFRDNDYYGDWYFATGYGDIIGCVQWQAAPYGQEIGSTFDNCTSGGGGGGGGGGALGLDADTATLEGSTGRWSPWYSSSIAQSTTEANSGIASLAATIGASIWALNLDNWPGFDTDENEKTVSFWAKRASGATTGDVAMRVYWRDDSGTDLRMDTITISSLNETWQEGSAVLTPPAGTTKLFLVVGGTSGVPGDVIYLDDFSVVDN